MKVFFPLLFLACLLSGCTSLSHRWMPGTPKAPIQHVFVERRLADNHALNNIIVRELQALGYTAETGPLTMMPERGVDVILSYDDRWTWDFRTYMVEFRVSVRDVKTSQLVGVGHYFRPSVFNHTPVEMIQSVLKPLFGQAPKAPAAAAAR